MYVAYYCSFSVARPSALAARGANAVMARAISQRDRDCRSVGDLRLCAWNHARAYSKGHPCSGPLARRSASVSSRNSALGDDIAPPVEFGPAHVVQGLRHQQSGRTTHRALDVTVFASIATTTNANDVR